MSEASFLRSQRFRAEREEQWLRLDKLLTRAERGSIRSLSDADLADIPVLYRSALSSLSVARETSLDQGLVDYLESLSARAYFFVYGARTSLLKRVGGFFARDLPLAVQALWRETLVSAGVTLATAVLSYGLVRANSQWFYSFVGKDMAEGRDPAASTKALADTLHHADQSGLTTLATFLMTHNAQIAIMAFALGFAFCLPTILLIAMNGLTLGAFIGLFASRGLGIEAGGWLSIHGTTEMFAIILAGAAGIHIGWAAGFPGPRLRLEAMAQEGRRGAAVMGGVVVMLFFAGLLEGFGRQLIDVTPARYAVGAVMLVLWCVYYYGPRRAP